MSSVPPDSGYTTPMSSDTRPGGPKGCWRTGLIGCGIAGLLVLLCIVGSFLYLRRNPQVMTDFFMARVDGALASDVTEREKSDLHTAYAAYRDGIQKRVPRQRSLEQIQTILMRNRTGSFSREQVRELTAVFREGAGLPATTPAPDSAATPGPGTTPGLFVSPGGTMTPRASSPGASSRL